MNDLEKIIGNTAISIKGMEVRSENIVITFDNGKCITFWHDQDCCESVDVEDVCGDVNDLIGSPIVIAREVIEEGSEDYGTSTSTFYEFATNKGSVTVRWYGTSNGYYSESVSYSYEDSEE